MEATKLLTFLAPRVWTDIAAAAATSKHPARVAVAYFGEQGDRLLPLRSGSALVTDASVAAVSHGVTCPRALERMRKKGISIYTFAGLHAKVYVFRDLAFVGSANASRHSEATLVEAVVRIDERSAVKAARDFVESLCWSRLGADDIAELDRYYRPPRFVPRAESNVKRRSKFRTLIMELTHEQGGGRETQVQPPIGVWEHFFGIRPNVTRLPELTLSNEAASKPQGVKRRVVRHHHNLTLEVAGADLPRPAILHMRRIGQHKYSYRVHRPTDKTYGVVNELLRITPNPRHASGRRWIIT